MYDIGRSKRAERAFSLDDVAIIPSRRTRGEEQVDLSWKIDAVQLEFPILAAPMDSIMSPATVIEVGRLGGLGVLNLEGLWTRYEDPEPILAELADCDAADSTARLQQVYSAPIQPDLIRARMDEIRDAGVPVAGALSPQNTQEFGEHVVASQPDFFVIRGTAVSAEHVSDAVEPLNLKKFIHQLDVPVIVGGCANYRTAMHLMRTGAAGVLVGFGGGAAHSSREVLGLEVPMATAIADVAEARRDYMDESGGRYVQVIADGSVGRSGDIAKAIACGADAVMVGAPLARATEAPGRGWHWGAEAWHASLPRGARVHFEQVGSLAEILVGPSHTSDGSMNLTGALRRSMAITGYTDVKSFQRIEIVVH
ncbi:GuaB3 family IMP dehydrogenase-related protein [Tessaracoccus sp. SD287]|uniref:GuaB3 family IMP dehydrogenase-related protein n=1 Tax=Tessaracoccus sp. SD287 TaxID=2782008 RepID=UPI001A95DF82|nr:GuaB3 family IMP dehydrogenase-related protein [Tessaracoccus sp. SD287]MBO1031534.1 GuaB3 family IMP dehydrogenase-related protein [Tessaracoccus sp. SD287]